MVENLNFFLLILHKNLKFHNLIEQGIIGVHTLNWWPWCTNVLDAWL